MVVKTYMVSNISLNWNFSYHRYRCFSTRRNLIVGQQLRTLTFTELVQRKTVTHGSLKVTVFITQSCSTLSDPMDCSPPGSSVHRTLHIYSCISNIRNTMSQEPIFFLIIFFFQTKRILECLHLSFRISYFLMEKIQMNYSMKIFISAFY